MPIGSSAVLPDARRRALRLAVFTAATVLLAVMLTGMLWRAMDTFDIWCQMRAGEEIMRTGAVPLVDTYSYTRAGAPWLLNAWLSAVFFAAVYALAGAAGLTIVKIALGLLFFAGMIAILRARRATTETILLIMLWAVLANLRFWPVRVYLFSSLLALACYALMVRDRLTLRQRLLAVLLMALWGNLHFGFTVGLLFAGLRVIDRALRCMPWRADLLMLIGMALAVLANPYGAALYGYAATLRNFADLTMIGEWQPLWRLLPADFPAEYWATGVALVGGVLLLGRRDWFKGGVALLLGAMALTAVRFVPLAGSIGLLAAVHVRGRLLALAATCLCAVAILMSPAQRDFWRGAFTAELDPLAFPVAATAWLRSSQPPGNLFNEQRWGAWLVYQAPEYRIFSDGRTDVYVTLFADEKLIRTCAPGWQDRLDRYRINTVLLATTGHPALRQALQAAPAWVIAYCDELAIIFVRRQPLPEPAA